MRHFGYSVLSLIFVSTGFAEVFNHVVEVKITITSTFIPYNVQLKHQSLRNDTLAADTLLMNSHYTYCNWLQNVETLFVQGISLPFLPKQCCLKVKWKR